MTLPEIEKQADAKYPRPPKECRLERSLRLAAKAAFIKKQMVKYGLVVDENEVN